MVFCSDSNISLYWCLDFKLKSKETSKNAFRKFGVLKISHGRRELNMRVINVFCHDFDCGSITITPDLVFGSGQYIQVARLYHGHCKFLEGKILIIGKVLYNFFGAGVSVEILIGREEALAIIQVYIILILEHFGCAYVHRGGVS